MRDKPWFGPFLADLRLNGNMAAAARLVGVPYRTVMNARKADADFEAAVVDALEESYDDMEREARRRAVEGVEEPVYQGGALVGTKRVYSDSLMTFLLKGYRRRTFGDKTEITGANGGPLAITDETKRAARIAALLALAKDRKDNGLPPDSEVDGLV